MRAVLVGAIVAAIAGRARADACDYEVARSVHKILVSLPDDDADDPALRRQAVIELTPNVFHVIADLGVGADAPILAEADDDQIAALTDAGWKVEIADYHDRIHLPSTVIDVAGRGRLEPPLAIRGWKLDAKRTAAVPYLVQLRAMGPGTLHDDFIASLAELGLAAAEHYMFSFDVVMTPAQAKKVAALFEVEWVGRVEPLYKIDTRLVPDSPCTWFSVDHLDELAEAAADADADADTGAERLELTVKLLADTPALRKAIKAAGGKVRFVDDRGALGVTAPRRAIRLLANRPEVAEIWPQ